MLNAKMSQTNVDGYDEFAVRQIQAFCRQIKSLLFEPFKGVCKIEIIRASELLEPVNQYLHGKRDKPPTAEEVQAIVLKLDESAKVMKERCPDEELLNMILECGPTLKTYLDYIDTNHSNQLKWNNDWIVTETKMCPQESMLSDMRHLLNGWNIEQNVKYNGHVSFLDS